MPPANADIRSLGYRQKLAHRLRRQGIGGQGDSNVFCDGEPRFEQR